MSKRKKLSSQLNNVFNAANDSFSPLSLGNLAAWYKPGIGVTGTLTAANWADQSGNGRDLAQGTAGNQPIYLPYSGTAYGWMPGIAGNHFTSDASPTIVNLDVRFQIALDDYTPAAVMTIVSQYNATGNQKSWVVDIGTLGDLHLGVSLDGSTYESPEIGTNILAGYAAASTNWFRVARIDSTGGITAYVSTDYDPSNINSGTWTSIGTGTSSSGALFDSTHTVDIGTYQSGAGQMYLGKNFLTQIVSGGTLAVDFNPSTFAETSTNGATAVASTGETWTLNSTGAKPAQIVKSAQLMTVAASTHYMATAGFTLDQPCTWYAVMAPTGYNSGADQVFVFGETTTTNVALYNQNGGSNLAIYAGSTAASVAAPTAGAFHVFSAVFNGASSLWSYDAQAANTGDPGAGNPSGLTIGAGLSAAAPASARYKELIVFSAAHTAAQRAQMQSWLNSRYGTF